MATQGITNYPQTFGVRLTVEQAQKLRAIAQADDRPPTSLARRLIVDGLARLPDVPAENDEG